MNLNTNVVSPELAKTAKTGEDLQALEREDGYELTDEQLDDVAGGRENGTQVLIHRMPRGNFK